MNEEIHETELREIELEAVKAIDDWREEGPFTLFERLYSLMLFEEYDGVMALLHYGMQYELQYGNDEPMPIPELKKKCGYL